MMEARGDYQGALQVHSELMAQRLQAGDRWALLIREKGEKDEFLTP